MSQDVESARGQTTTSPDLKTASPEAQSLTTFKGSLKRAVEDHVITQQEPMKRSRAQSSPKMSPGANNEGFSVNGGDRTVDGPEVEAVTIVGAGPAGLMLGYVGIFHFKSFRG